MFGTSPRDLCATLSEMERVALERSRFNQIEARDVLKSWIRNDQRFAQYNPDVLAARVQECKSNGAVLDLDDPRLRGQPARPLERSHW
jgi:hypothetical protein